MPMGEMPNSLERPKKEEELLEIDRLRYAKVKGNESIQGDAVVEKYLRAELKGMGIEWDSSWDRIVLYLGEKGHEGVITIDNIYQRDGAGRMNHHTNKNPADTVYSPKGMLVPELQELVESRYPLDLLIPAIRIAQEKAKEEMESNERQRVIRELSK